MDSLKKRRFLIRLFVLAVLACVLLTAGWKLLNDEKTHKLEAGEKAPDFVLENIQTGEEFKLSDLKGKGVLVNFWATYCEPCKQEMPVFEKAASTYEKQDIIFAAISADQSSLVINRFRDRYALSFPLLKDNGNQVMDAYGVDALPATFFIRADGTISRTVYGPLQTKRLETYLDEIVP
ncbi:thiol-disulfide oxidoreductase ResA [Terribacillus sp. DMT04]|uniref:thiol-disulfide oxidoreductase ResA n=1 Tax=Terribacillus sp. DMT04 TaxID=2850441 RepID=UPI001C2CC460|nr:thiol-disulfide oxidoreductase ResA [Terribacillus sp. DMT04]QXE00308.1 thiol-disulfide oxidoreductase ResA [Terribacillus sp. DMT04]